MTVKEKVDTKATAAAPGSAGVSGTILSAYRSGMSVIESSVNFAAEIPLGVASTLGVSDESTDSLRDSHRTMVRGIHSRLDSVTSGVIDLAGKQASMVTGAATTAVKKATPTS